MPGKLHSEYPSQQKPYIIYRKNGQILDKYGNQTLVTLPEAYVSLEDFIYRD